MSNSLTSPFAPRTGSGVVPPGEIELELGVPMPGAILPQERWVQTALKRLPADGPLDWDLLFGRPAPRVLDLGCGNGRFVVSSAVRRPDMNHLGVDSLPVVIRYATRRGNQRGLSNARFAVCGAWEFLERLTAPESLDEIHLYHPQPYADQAESHRRLLTPEFFLLVHRALRPLGRFYVQTDSKPYWMHIVSVAPEFLFFHEQTGPWPEDPLGRTRREIIARERGLTIYRGWGEKRHDRTLEQLGELVSSLPRPDFAATRRASKFRGKSRRRQKRRR